MTGESCCIHANTINLHYLNYPGSGPTIILMHGITANARSFGLLAEKLSPKYHLIVPDLRGRGLSDKPATGYTMADHAADIIGMMDALGIKQAIIGGHSFGGLVAYYLAAHYPERATKVIAMDAGFIHPKVAELIRPALARLGNTWPSWDAYIQTMKAAPYWEGQWEPAMEDYYRADVETLPDGAVKPRATAQNMLEANDTGAQENWAAIFSKVRQPTLLINAPTPFGPAGTPAVIPEEQARATVAALPNGRYVAVPGTHYSMIFSKGAAQVAEAIRAFVDES